MDHQRSTQCCQATSVSHVTEVSPTPTQMCHPHEAVPFAGAAIADRNVGGATRRCCACCKLYVYVYVHAYFLQVRESVASVTGLISLLSINATLHPRPCSAGIRNLHPQKKPLSRLATKAWSKAHESRRLDERFLFARGSGRGPGPRAWPCPGAPAPRGDSLRAAWSSRLVTSCGPRHTECLSETGERT